MKFSFFTRNIMQWYRFSARDLPWRKTRDPYKIWISEVMLQQTTVKAVIPYYLRWIKQYPNAQSVARASLQTILKSWQGLGYYSRAKNIHAATKVICHQFAGKFPNDREAIRTLPGLGPYTTGAVLSIAFDKREPIIDANVRRVVMRQLKISGKANSTQDRKIVEFLLQVMPQRNNRIFNQSLMELGALICRSKNPLCLLCPVRKSCLAYKDGVVDIIPEPKMQVIKNVNIAIAVIKHKGKYFFQKRPAKGLFADLWEFPGGKIEKREIPEKALIREVREEIGIEIEIEKRLSNVTQFYTQFKADLHIWICRPKTLPSIDKFHKWLKIDDLNRFPMPSGTVKIIEMLKNLS